MKHREHLPFRLFEGEKKHTQNFEKIIVCLVFLILKVNYGYPFSLFCFLFGRKMTAVLNKMKEITSSEHPISELNEITEYYHEMNSVPSFLMLHNIFLCFLSIVIAIRKGLPGTCLFKIPNNLLCQI